MFNTPDKVLFALAVVIYGGMTTYAFFLWKKGFSKEERTSYWMLVVAGVFHTAAMVQRGISFARCPVNNLYEATVFMTWAIMAVCVGIGMFRKLRFLVALASPILFGLGVFAMFPNLDSFHERPEFSHGALSMHVALILLAYGAFALAAMSSAMYLSQEHDLKFNKMRAIHAIIPPIVRLEKATVRLLWTGVVLMAWGLAIGFGVVRKLEDFKSGGDAKVYWAVMVWLAYLALLIGRWKWKWHGKRLAWISVLFFAFVMMTFWGTNLMSNIHNPE